MTTSTTTRTSLVLADVCLTVGDADNAVTALDHVNLTVSRGEFVAIVGPSGSGKSSLLAVAGGLTSPDSGTVQVSDHDLTQLSATRRARFRMDTIGFVFQSGNLIPALSAADQLRLVGHAGGRSVRRRARDPLELLAAVGLSAKARSRPHQLSGGERQRVGIARALYAQPTLLLVDEPTAALDRARSHEIVQLLATETRERGVATVMVTHDHDVLEHCDRVLEMVDGRLS
ncbi:ABC transporter ATP-binding protein [Nocardia sp. NPDC004151]|uniref:ABC transporter ATP-binding protein n=1 Tax=Nocardia sp. NPDC004151 TaxID=3364304 RepID=UPI0036CFB153